MYEQRTRRTRWACEDMLASSIKWSISSTLGSNQIMKSPTLLCILWLPQHPKMMVHPLLSMSSQFDSEPAHLGEPQPLI